MDEPKAGVCGALLAIVIMASCQTVQQTGRSQFIFVSESQERQLGEDAYKETLRKDRLSTRGDWQAQLRRVGQRIAAVADRPVYKWEFNVLQGKEVNAFALPGGKVAFWEGIMPIAQDDAAVAVVMGHEIAHALARHGAERMSQSMGAQAIGQILSVGVSAVNQACAKISSSSMASAQPSGSCFPGDAHRNRRPIASV